MIINNIHGKTISMRLAELNDASFIYSLRTDSRYNKYLSKITGTVKEQEKWLSDYKKKEKDEREYYYIIFRNDNNKKIGTIRLYDFIKDKKSFCWGSWILNQDKTRTAAVESALLIYNMAFTKFGFLQSHFDVRKDNEKVINFHQRFGATQVGETELDYLFVYLRNDFFNYAKSLEKFMVCND